MPADERYIFVDGMAEISFRAHLHDIRPAVSVMRVQHLFEGRSDGPEDGAEKFVFALEIIVDVAQSHLRGIGYFAHGRFLESFLQEQFLCRLYKFFSYVTFLYLHVIG